MLTSLLAAFLSTSIPVVQATEAVTNAAMPSVAVHRVLYPFRPGVVFGLGFGLSVPAGTY